MFELFAVLDNQPNREDIYDGWLADIPTKLINTSIKSYASINLTDPKQRDEIVFPLFRYNMKVIDFWLSNSVFPSEAKSFRKKLVATAWDLCGDNLTHKMCGFCGTNDTKNMLPLTVTQNDLEQLEQTNNNVREALLYQKIASYDRLPPNINGKSILARLVKAKIPVLLDAGALMLELNNQQVASKWLMLASDVDFDAAVYFSAHDVLMTIDQNGVIVEFDNSVYHDNLDRCLVYLDAMHTRGTDLKFPIDIKACVTLSADITRDETVQACMRMRLLGKGHSIVFWGSFEADARIRETCRDSRKVTNKNVIKFITENSKRFEKENAAHWSAAGFNYAKKLAAHQRYGQPNTMRKDENALKRLYDACIDNEFSLNDLYGEKKNLWFAKITHVKFSNLKKNEDYKNCPHIMGAIRRNNEQINKRLFEESWVGDTYAQAQPSLDEEHEREFEQKIEEIEEERQVHRPTIVSAIKHTFDERMTSLILAPNKQTIIRNKSNRLGSSNHQTAASIHA